MQLPVADLYDLAVDFAFQLPAYVSLAAAVACVVLLPLYFSQRRDLQRLQAWMEREPGHPQADIAASEALLDRAETELEALFGPERAPGGELQVLEMDVMRPAAANAPAAHQDAPV